MTAAGRRIEVRGEVQGVGFRPWVWRLAREQGVGGQVRNDSSGVTIEAFGDERALDAFVDRLASQPPRAARVRRLEWSPIPHRPIVEFVIARSEARERPRVSIPPDLALCDDCLREIRDPLDRRFGYAFTNCTSCGPRFTISLAVPYDRKATTMAPFTMCADCQREYDDPADRRFHAQPNACPRCGPRLVLATADGEPVAGDDPIREAARALGAGAIVAIKGLGGFHLACDARDEAAVETLRRRKGRDQKPFAVMVADLGAARRLANLSEQEAALLEGCERPIVLVRRRRDAALAAGVAPRNPMLGLLLPYTPLHHLLLAAADRPLVMTSGNLAEEPIAAGNAEALERLGTLADFFLLHDREIATRCDDSVARVVAGGPVLLRRSRGWVPRPIALARAVERPILACGAQLKNTFCVAVGDQAYLGPHVGDLDTLASLEWFEEAVSRMERFLEVEAEVVAHDLHPDYLSTRYALDRPAAARVAVQHHHAHLAAVLAEYGVARPAVGVVWDGTGFGSDGTAWGGEILWGDALGFDRLATLRPIALAGGDLAIREAWRIALALLDDAFDGRPPLDRLALFSGSDPDRVAVVRAMIERKVNAPLARGMGRVFDAIGALVLCRSESAYEGQIAVEWNLVAGAGTLAGDRGRYPYVIDRSREPWELDLRPMVRRVVADLLARESASRISTRFHHTLSAAAAEILSALPAETRRAPVVLAGGCFQNALLAESLIARLSDRRVLLPRQAPPGDGGIALGQALVADAWMRVRRCVRELRAVPGGDDLAVKGEGRCVSAFQGG